MIKSKKEADKYTAYILGLYKFPVVPVSSAFWSHDNWVDYITSQGCWQVEVR